MAEPMYFQWQNKFLLQTIYPRRNRKLADFLIYLQEIELWQEYKDKQLSQAEIDAYTEEHKKAVIIAFKSFNTEKTYFTREDVRTHYASFRADDVELAPIKEMHTAFNKYLQSYRNVRKEKNLVAWYISTWEQKLKKAAEEVKRLERRRNVIAPNHSEQVNITRELDRLQKITLPILTEELKRLINFLALYNKTEKRKQEFYTLTDAAKKELPNLQSTLASTRTLLRDLEADRREVSATLARMRNPPRRDSQEKYFQTENVFDELCREFPQADSTVIDTICDLHKSFVSELRLLTDDEVKRSRLGNFVSELQRQYDKLFKEVSRLESQVGGRSMDAEQHGARSAGLKAMEMELEKLSEYHAAFEYATERQKKMQQEMRARQVKLESDLKRVEGRIGTLQGQASALETEVKSKEAILAMDETQYLVEFKPDVKPVTVQDIVRAKAAKYKEDIEKRIDPDLPQEAVQQDLLEEIVQRFIQKPGEFPPWLQYMVIHFSGMRYATAHGSWADPKDLLKSLRMVALQKQFKLLAADPDAVEGMVDERLDAYESPDPAKSPKLAFTDHEKSKAKLAALLQALKLPYGKRNTLFELRLMEQEYDIDQMEPTEALEQLKELRASDKDVIPDWMWQEIVKLTDLRVQNAKDPNWNKLTEAQQEEKNQARYAELREIMNKWKEKNLTGWREEHDRANRLIVTSSVCNEVAEQILHLRGYSPSGGLTGLVDWYMNKVNEGKRADPSERYFVFAKEGAETKYKEGATVLWLRFVHEEPNPWRKAKPMAIGGDRLIPDKYRQNGGKEGQWAYFEGDFVTRKRTRVIDKRQSVKEQQWLRWMHAATVAKVAETVEGPVVLTFETALPYDDPSVSAVGIFKHYRHNLMWDGGEDNYNGSFIAYIPNAVIPADDLKEMLDWNKILRRQVMTPRQLEDYHKKYIQVA